VRVFSHFHRFPCIADEFLSLYEHVGVISYPLWYDDLMVAKRQKVSVGSFALLKERPSVPDGPVEFLRFCVNGEKVEVSKYENSDLVWERTMGRHQARVVWRNALKNGFREDRR
jgi:hypothetical protein